MERGSSHIYLDIEKASNELYKRAGLSAPEYNEFIELVSEMEVKSRLISQDNLQPWLAILELGLKWIANVHVNLTANGEIPSEQHRRIIWSLLGAICSYGLSIRSLAIQGFDNSARALLRTFTETLFLCLAILDEPALGNKFYEAGTSEQIKDFWHQTISPKKLHKRIIEIESKFGLESNEIDELTAWRIEEYDVLSQSVHASYLASCFSCFTPDLKADDTMLPAILGQASINSIRTVSYAARSIWYFSRISFIYIFEGKDTLSPIIKFNKSDDGHKSIFIERQLLSDVTLKYWDK